MKITKNKNIGDSLVFFVLSFYFVASTCFYLESDYVLMAESYIALYFTAVIYVLWGVLINPSDESGSVALFFLMPGGMAMMLFGVLQTRILENSFEDSEIGFNYCVHSILILITLMFIISRIVNKYLGVAQ